MVTDIQQIPELRTLILVGMAPDQLLVALMQAQLSRNANRVARELPAELRQPESPHA